MLAGVTIHNFFFIGLMASIFIVFFKWATTRPGMPTGLTKFAGAI